MDKLASFPVAIPSETIEQIAAGNDIVDVIGSYFPLKRAGANFKALCPFHQEKTPSFTVSPSRQTFHCFGCSAGGSVSGWFSGPTISVTDAIVMNTSPMVNST